MAEYPPTTPAVTDTMQGMRAAILTAALIAVSALAATPAHATHQASPEEAATIILQTSASAVAGEASGCYKVDLSDLDPTWALERFVGEPFQNGCGGGAGGSAIVHDDPPGRWYVDKAGGSGWGEACPGPVESGPMPTPVALELGFCVLPSKKVYFRDFQREAFVYKPSHLPQGAHGGYERLRWYRWGSSQTIGHGVFVYGDAGEEREGYLPPGGLRLPVRIVLSHVIVCSAGGRRVYRDESVSYVLPRSPNGTPGGTRHARLRLGCS
jgi:hypothetical protein